MSESVQVMIIVVCRNPACKMYNLVQSVYREVQGDFSKVDVEPQEIARVGFSMQPDKCESCDQALEALPEVNSDEDEQ